MTRIIDIPDEKVTTITVTIARPKRARWSTYDGDGELNLWRRKPKPSDDEPDGWWCHEDDDSLTRIDTGIPRPDWRETLRKL